MPKTHPLAQFWSSIAELEAKRKSKIFALVHSHQDPDHNHICGPTLNCIIQQRKLIKTVEKIELLLHTPGGSADIAFRAVKFFRARAKVLNVIVPIMAKSAGTLMCLGADNIYMGEFAELGPLDVQLGDPLKRGSKMLSPLDEFKSAEFLRDYAVEVFDFITATILRRSGMSVQEAIHESVPFATSIMRPLYEQLDPLQIGEHRRSLAIGEDYGRRLLNTVANPLADEIVQKLVSGYPSHEFVIDREEASRIGLPIRSLDARQEHTLITALEGILQNEATVHGFVPQAPPTKKPKGSAQAASRTTDEKPAAKPALVAS
ncbi:MAG: hypothetical protein JSS69_18450 [Acidobacteria bacterium]|nr:hypothetical protein [Acidobacteriota bacterium]MBS1867896.1 hypothetical protein [Acidobacteriota bacterium]